MPYYYRRKRRKKADIAVDSPKVKVTKRIDYVDKLDRIFSKYIRLRDALPSGVIRCISCGQIKEFDRFDCGHYFSRTHMATRWNEWNCNAECMSCLTPDALILMKDLTWKKLGHLSVGDEVFSFDEEITFKTSRRYKVGKVTFIKREVNDVYEVELENGDKINATADHKWLTRSRQGTSYQWVETQDMWINGVNLYGKHKTGPHTDKITTIVCKPFMVVGKIESYDSGWLAGMIDADGHVCQQNIHNEDGSIRYGLRIGVAQSECYPDICAKIQELITKFTGNKACTQRKINATDKRGIKSNKQMFQYLVTGTNVEKIQFLQRLRPNKITKIDIEKLGKLKSQYDCKVKSITPIGKQEIVVMEVDTHTYIANGYAMHNCNRFSADHLIGYRENLIKKIGETKFKLLEIQAHDTKQWSEFELKMLCDVYQKKVKELSKEKGIDVK